VSPLLIAHRGASHAAPENTLHAFRLALAERAGGLELDVRLSADAEPVIFHDAELDRLTTLSGPLVARTWAELAQLQIRRLHHPERAGEGGPRESAHLASSTSLNDTRLPHLAELLPLLDTHPEPLQLNVELKPTPTPQRLVAATRPQLERLAAKPSNELVISSFDPRVLALFASQPLVAPHRLALLFEDPNALSALRFLPTVDLHPHASLLTPEALAAWSAPGRRFRAWTVDDPSEARRLLALDPDIALITNRPGPLKAELAPCLL
jgi:glycerophosphoryl diester phosphodiesterase